MDPVENALRWSRWTVSGPESAISKAFSVLDSSLPNGWKCLTGEDLSLTYRWSSRDLGWYALDTTPSYVGVVPSVSNGPGNPS